MFELGFQVCGRRTAGRVLPQAALYGVHECWSKGRGQAGRFGSLIGPRRKALREGLDQGYAESPDITGRGKFAASCFWGIVHGTFRDACPGFVGGTDGITCEFQLIIDDEKVCRLQLALHQVIAVKESQGIQGGKEQILHFLGSKSPVAKDLSESLFGIFHYDEEKLATSELAQTCVKKPDQARMGEAGSGPPVRELCQCDPLSRDDLDGGSGNVLCLTFGEEYRAVV